MGPQIQEVSALCLTVYGRFDQIRDSLRALSMRLLSFVMVVLLSSYAQGRGVMSMNA